MSRSAPAQRFVFDEKLSHIRSRGIDIHPHLPDNCPTDSDGVPVFAWSINRLLPSYDDAYGILKFFGLNLSTIQQVLALYARDSEPHINHGKAVPDGDNYKFPLAQRLFELYGGRYLKRGSYEQSYDGYIIAGIQHGGLDSDFAIWCGLSKDDPRYKDDLMETWYQMTPIQYTWEIVEGNQCQLEELWIGKIHATKDRSSSMESSMTSEVSASADATPTLLATKDISSSMESSMTSEGLESPDATPMLLATKDISSSMESLVISEGSASTEAITVSPASTPRKHERGIEGE